jgi:hypothetical protein
MQNYNVYWPHLAINAQQQGQKNPNSKFYNRKMR